MNNREVDSVAGSDRSTTGWTERFAVFPALGMTIPFLVLLVVAVTAGCNGLVGADELEIGIGQRQLKLDPRVNSDDQDQELHALIFNGLTRRKDATEVIPDLAESFAASPDQRRFTFQLRKGVRFHNDRELSSLDVRYTYATMMRSDFISDPKERLGEIIDSIELPDSNTVVFLCRKPYPSFPAMVSGIGIIPEGTSRHQMQRPIGTGPYRFVSLGADGRIRLTRHREYFRPH